MIVVMKSDSSQEAIQRVARRIEELGLKAHIIVGTERTVVAAIGQKRNGEQRPVGAKRGERLDDRLQRKQRSEADWLVAAFLFVELAAHGIDRGRGGEADSGRHADSGLPSPGRRNWREDQSGQRAADWSAGLFD